MPLRSRLLACALLLFAIAMPAAAQHGGAGKPGGIDRDTALATSQAAIGRTVGDHRFIGSDGREHRLSDYRGKPLIVSLVYTSCFHICPTTTRHLADVISRAQTVLGEDSFAVVTLGFDAARDTPQAMREFANAQRASALHWDFLSGDKATIEAFAGELGFLYAPTGGGFDHLLQTSLIDADGVVRRQVYGLDYDTPILIEPLKRLVFGDALEDSFLERMGNRFRLFCTVYDPASDSYRFNYSIIVGIGIGAVTGLFFILLLVREWRYSNRAAREARAAGATNREDRA